MYEIRDREFYELYRQYPRCVLDYVIIGDSGEYQGLEGHKKAVLFALSVINERIKQSGVRWSCDEGCMRAQKESVPDFFAAPEKPYKKTLKDVALMDLPEELKYWSAFLEPPHSTGYTLADWEKINGVLFPYGREELEIYRWKEDFSDYFRAGREWWGAAMWSIWDPRMGRYVVIGASSTD
ncbi:MAG: hypothetical protein Q4A78_04515 [Peptostreptococcaceae bacterium]|nr:hypothetical protein [Peptostreptococcaceae bacterium]